MFRQLRKYRIISSAEHIDIDEALHIAEALAEAGLPVMEIAYKNHQDALIIRAVLERFPEFIIGAGGILNADLLMRACEVGACFASSPGVKVEIIQEALKHNIEYAAGVCTPTDIETAITSGITNLKFFPAQFFGGAPLLVELLKPFAHLNLDVIAKGGITEEVLRDYLRVPQVAAVSCPWIVKDVDVQYKNWAKITEAAIKVRELTQEKETVYFRK